MMTPLSAQKAKTFREQECIPVGCVPPACCPHLPGPGRGGVPGLGGSVPGLGGVPGLGVYLVRGCTWSGGVPGPRGVPGLGGVPGPRGGYLPRYSPREQNDRQVQKYYLTPNFVCGR